MLFEIDSQSDINVRFPTKQGVEPLLEPFSLPFVQEGLVEILLLSVAAGLIGSWLVLRGLAFYSHAVGTASFPGLVLADGVGFPAALGAFGMAGVFTAVSSLLARARNSTVSDCR